MSPTKARLWQSAAGAAALLATVASPVPAEAARPSFKTECGPTDVSLGAKTCTYTFPFTQTIETFVVPPTTEPVRITVIGAPGGLERRFRSRGAVVTGSFTNLAGMPIFVTVGGEGWFDGYNGGGPGGGGGASDVRFGGKDLNNRIIVAGGGGGSGERLEFDPSIAAHRFMLVKGGDAGEPGYGSGGAAGTASAGGDGGGNHPGRGEPGKLGRGGRGADGVSSGGGGGLYGGGGGGACAGAHQCLDSRPGSGGGGSSLVPRGGTFALSDDPAPKVIITVTRYGWCGLP
jgi:Glycine rich protein